MRKFLHIESRVVRQLRLVVSLRGQRGEPFDSRTIYSSDDPRDLDEIIDAIVEKNPDTVVDRFIYYILEAN